MAQSVQRWAISASYPIAVRGQPGWLSRYSDGHYHCPISWRYWAARMAQSVQWWALPAPVGGKGQPGWLNR
jgi:hypothetical protein